MSSPSAPKSATLAVPHDTLANADLLPVAVEFRTWNWWHIASLWIGMAICIPTYMLASGLIQSGMNWWQAVGTVLLANVIVLIPLTLNAHPGTQYGIPFPVLLRTSFGTRGANIPAVMRGLVACGWFGIQTWIGGKAIYSMCAVLTGIASTPPPSEIIPYLGISGGELAAFIVFWLVNMFVVWRGMESIKWLEVLSAPFLLIVGLGLLGWAWIAAKGFGPIMTQPDKFSTATEFWATFAPGLTGMVAFWATLSLNIPDFSRFARSQKDQIIGQAVGLPPTMTLFAFIGVAVTGATVVVFGEAIWDPVVLLGRFTNPLIVALALAALVISTLTTNIAANVVSPANDFSNLLPGRISFRTGGMITGVIGLLIQPWRLVQDPKGYFFDWLIGYSALLGPVAGIMIADYYLCRNKILNVEALYQTHGEYRYTGGFSVIGLVSLGVAILPNIPGFLVTVKAIPARSVSPFFVQSYHYAWFVGFFLALGIYWFTRKIQISLAWNKQAYEELAL